MSEDCIDTVEQRNCEASIQSMSLYPSYIRAPVFSLVRFGHEENVPEGVFSEKNVVPSEILCHIEAGLFYR